MSNTYWKRVSRRFGIAGLVLGAWGLFYPKPYLLVVPLLAVTPLLGIAVARLSRGTVDPLDDKEQGYNLATFVILPPIVLGLRDILDFPPLDGSRLLVFGAVSGLACGLIYLWIRPQYVSAKPRRWWDVAIGWVASVWYGWALIAMLNGLLPQHSPQRFEVPVLGQHVSTGKHTSYYLKLPPLGPVREPEEWDVGRDIYKRVKVGGRVCVYVYPGALGDPWYDAELCDESPGVS